MVDVLPFVLFRNRIGIAADDHERVLINNTAALPAAVQVVPVAAYTGFNFVSGAVARMKTGVFCLIPADANPCAYIIGVLCDVFFHVDIITQHVHQASMRAWRTLEDNGVRFRG
jgi:hypothetical protein